MHGAAAGGHEGPTIEEDDRSSGEEDDNSGAKDVSSTAHSFPISTLGEVHGAAAGPAATLPECEICGSAKDIVNVDDMNTSLDTGEDTPTSRLSYKEQLHATFLKERLATDEFIRTAKAKRLPKTSASKRELSNSDDSDPSHLKPAMQKMKGGKMEQLHARSKSNRADKWGTMPELVQKENHYFPAGLSSRRTLVRRHSMG